MPVILEKKDEKEWLNPDETEPARLLKLLHPYPASEMDTYPVSRLVNSPAKDTKEVIEPVSKEKLNYKVLSGDTNVGSTST